MEKHATYLLYEQILKCRQPNLLGILRFFQKHIKEINTGEFQKDENMQFNFCKMMSWSVSHYI